MVFVFLPRSIVHSDPIRNRLRGLRCTSGWSIPFDRRVSVDGVDLGKSFFASSRNVAPPYILSLETTPKPTLVQPSPASTTPTPLSNETISVCLSVDPFFPALFHKTKIARPIY